VNDSFAERSVELSTGGRDGGGSRLTPFGKALIKAYRRFEDAAGTLAARHFAGIKARGGAGAEPTPVRRPLRRSVLARPRSRR